MSSDGATDVAIAKKLKMSAPELARAWAALEEASEDNTRDDVAVLMARLLLDAKDALVDEKAALALVMATPREEAVVVLDNMGNITSVSMQSASILGKTSSDLIGMPIDTLLAGRARGVLKSTDEMARAEGGERVHTMRTHMRDDGTTFLAEHTVIALVGRTGVTSGFARDICDVTARRMHEVRIEELDASVALLIAG
ncbi:MAG TPA: PAS domain-containing protein [Fimbriimonas sp.]|nr:PAS domain-containing protein [Fimbriimonas sp.]